MSNLGKIIGPNPSNIRQLLCSSHYVVSVYVEGLNWQFFDDKFAHELVEKYGFDAAHNFSAGNPRAAADLRGLL